MKFSDNLIKTATILCAPALIIAALSSCEQTTSSSSSDGDGTLSIGISNGGQQLASPPNILVVGAITYTSVKINLGRVVIKNINSLDSINFRQDTPLIVALRLDTTIQNIGSIPIPPGTYDETRFRINKLGNSDGAVYVDSVEMRDISIRVAGYMKGSLDSSFVWTSDINEQQIHNFAPITVTPGDTINLVFEFDVSQWFSDGVGGELDPRTAISAGTTKQTVENNIRTAFRVYQK